ncbi:MAG TPA: hypothetical protein VFL19_03780 [Nitrospira sp.]|nr:hypothetical protein [Nitrospira sp.]
MDQRTHDVEEDIKGILQTRLALADKIETLERHVEATVESTKAAALDALDLARNKAAGFIERTTEHLNPSIQGGRRPWIMVGTAIALGLFAGLIEQRRRHSGVYHYYPPDAEGADVMPEDGQSHEARGVYPFYGREQARPRPGRRELADSDESKVRDQEPSTMWQPFRALWDDLTTEVVQERDRVQQAVLLAGRSFIQDVVRMAGQSLLDQLTRSGPGAAGHPARRRLHDE